MTLGFYGVRTHSPKWIFRGLAENVFDLIAQLAPALLTLLVFDFTKLLKQATLLAVQALRRDDGRDDEEIAAPVALQRNDAFAFDAEDGTGLSAFWNGQCFIAIERRHNDLRAERSLRESDR